VDEYPIGFEHRITGSESLVGAPSYAAIARGAICGFRHPFFILGSEPYTRSIRASTMKAAGVRPGRLNRNCSAMGRKRMVRCQATSLKMAEPNPIAAGFGWFCAPQCVSTYAWRRNCAEVR
jgi:hypothetical protein